MVIIKELFRSVMEIESEGRKEMEWRVREVKEEEKRE